MIGASVVVTTAIFNVDWKTVQWDGWLNKHDAISLLIVGRAASRTWELVKISRSGLPHLSQPSGGPARGLCWNLGVLVWHRTRSTLVLLSTFQAPVEQVLLRLVYLLCTVFHIALWCWSDLNAVEKPLLLLLHYSSSVVPGTRYCHTSRQQRSTAIAVFFWRNMGLTCS